ncbi:MAG: LacI family DNA-binding transcriptional regulator [Ktedonobacteraceae bacterium]|nr:LacI family DNA-binding transcriptional regulator [Ktedonobacteraceae bacterium]
MVTSEQVAREAGVSRATVSRVLNGSANVSKETKKRIYSAIATLGYDANAFVRSSSQERSQLVALALNSENGLNLSHITGTNYYFYLEILRKMEQEAAKENYDFFLPSFSYRTLDAEADAETNYILTLRARQVAGVITLALSSTDPRIQGLCRSSIPAVFFDSIYQGNRATYIKSDYVDGARQATTHLLQLGHRRIAFFPGDPVSITGVERLLGHQQTMAQAGLIIDTNLVRQSNWDSKDAYQAAMVLLSERRDFTAIVAGSDMMAFGILRALRKHNLRVPEDISLIGFDNIDQSEDADPPLTTVQQNKQALSQGAVSLLTRLIKGEETPAPLIIPTQLIVRASTMAPPI